MNCKKKNILDQRMFSDLYLSVSSQANATGVNSYGLDLVTVLITIFSSKFIHLPQELVKPGWKIHVPGVREPFCLRRILIIY